MGVKYLRSLSFSRTKPKLATSPKISALDKVQGCASDLVLIMGKGKGQIPEIEEGRASMPKSRSLPTFLHGALAREQDADVRSHISEAFKVILSLTFLVKCAMHRAC